MLSKQKKKVYKIKIGIFWKSKMAAGGHIEILGCVLVSIIESNTIVWHMVSMRFSTNNLIYGIKFQLWVQIQDGRRTPYLILQKIGDLKLRCWNFKGGSSNNVFY